MAKDGEVVGAVVLSVAALILVHDHIKRPVQAVFDAPMGTGGLSETGKNESPADCAKYAGTQSNRTYHVLLTHFNLVYVEHYPL